MEISEARQAVKLRQWAEMVQARWMSGQTVRAWCEENNVALKTYYYRLKRVRLEALKSTGSNIQILPLHEKSSPAFAELSLSENDPLEGNEKDTGAPAVTINVGNMAIKIHNEAGAEIIENVIRAVSEVY